MKNIIDYFPINEDGKYINLENNKTYKNPRTILNYVYEKGMTGVEYVVKWSLVPENYVVYCKICNKPCVCISNHLKSNHKEYGGIKNYKKEYGENVAVISEIYKEYLSEKSKGENNVNHKSKTTLLERQQKSPFSIEFWKVKYPMKTDDQLNELLKVFRESALSDRKFNTRLEYYINRGYTEYEAIELLKTRQTTFSLEKCIDKYGEELGLKRWKERQNKWMQNNKKSNFSKISQTLFKTLYEKIKNKNLDIYFASLDKNKQYDDSGKNYEYYLQLSNIVIKPDFFIKNNNKIIEFDGTYYHRNTPENIKREQKRDEEIINSGYTVLHISEYDYKTNKHEVIKRCLDFINS